MARVPIADAKTMEETGHQGIKSGQTRENLGAAAPTREAIDYALALLRVGMGWVFFWAFLDKLFGLGYATESGNGWIDGGSPTFGFLNFAATGPLTGFYQSIAGNAVVDWLFMLGLAGVGIALLLGVGIRIASIAGAAMLLLMYTALILPENNPFLDDHIIYAVLLGAIAISSRGYDLGLGKWWGNTELAKKYPILL